MPLIEKAQLNGDHEHRAQYPKNGNDRNYEIPKSYHSQKNKIRVACVGAGPTGKSTHLFFPPKFGDASSEAGLT
jgi:hypothetical protein